MRKIKRQSAIVAAGVMLVALAAGAGFAAPQHKGHARGPMGMGGDFGHVMAEMAVHLDLDENQKQAIHEQMQGNREGMAAITERLHGARQNLAKAIHAPELDEAAIRAAAEDMGVVEGDLAVARAEMLRQVREVLTPEQQDKMEQMMAEHHAEMLADGPMLRRRHDGFGGGHGHGSGSPNSR